MPKKQEKRQYDERYRERAVIKEMQIGTEDHGINTCWITLEFGSSVQGFGGLILNNAKLRRSFVSDLCKVFDVSQPEELVGRKCYALRCFGVHNEPIEGLEEALTGKRFVMTDWIKKHQPETKDVLTRTKEALQTQIAQLEARIKRDKQHLKTIHKGYVDWSKA